MLTIGYWQRLTGKVPIGGRQVGLVEAPNGVLAMLVGGGICFAAICAVGTQRLLRDGASLNASDRAGSGRIHDTHPAAWRFGD
jgi:hypothetical protein